ncbi:MAG: Mur ligase family protein, partial [Candidatus Paceibacterota bacterium]
MKLNQIKKTPFLRKSLALLAALKHGFPAKDLKIIGITGTCGKTTTSFMVKNILEAAGLKTGLIGTAGYYLGDGEVILPKAKTPATTP